MRQFVVLGHEAPLDADFSLDALPSEAGRLDILARCVTAALLRSHGIREDVRVHLVLQDELTVRFDGGDVRNLNPDERSTAALIRKALGEKDEAIGHMAAEVSPGVSISRLGFAETLDEIAGGGTVVQLHEDGDPVVDVEPPADPVFVLSDHRDFTDTETETLDERVDERVRLGPEPLHADHAITVAHNYLDTDGYQGY
jgi:tRNA (pseudouridine54-N1)-methyltransferase